MRQWICILMISTSSVLSSAEVTPTDWNQADASYIAGENATSVAERTEAFNKALTLYLELEEKNKDALAFGNGSLYYNIGNTYFQLGEYPWAILYYYRALQLEPRDIKTLRNLQITQSKLTLTPPEPPSWISRFIGLQTYLSLPEKLQGVFHLGVALLMLASAYLWRPFRWLKHAMIIVMLPLLFLLGSIGYTQYFAPIEGVLVQPSVLYRDAGKQYAVVSNQPLLAGEKVFVVEERQNGAWLKILTDDGTVGFLPYDPIRLISK